MIEISGQRKMIKEL